MSLLNSNPAGLNALSTFILKDENATCPEAIQHGGPVLKPKPVDAPQRQRLPVQPYDLAIKGRQLRSVLSVASLGRTGGWQGR